MNFGDFFRLKRIEKGMTLRSYCNRYGLEPASISKIENNKLNPPKDENKLKALASSLELIEGTEDWIKFFDLAYQTHNELPLNIKNEASDVIKLLPRFLRTNDNKRLNRKKLEELIAFLQKGGE